MSALDAADANVGRCDDCGGQIHLPTAREEGRPGLCEVCAMLAEMRKQGS